MASIPAMSAAYDIRPARRMAAPASAAGRATAFDGLVFATAVGMLLIYSLAWAAPITGYSYENADSGFLRSVQFPAWAGCVFLLALCWQRALQGLWQNLVLVLVLAWVFASFTWSIDPATSLRRAIALCFISASGLAFGARFSWEELTEVMASAFGIVAVTSFFMGAFVPQFGRMHELFPGAWRGDYLEKNGLGGMMSTGVLLMAAAAIYVPKRRMLWLAGLALSLLLLILCTSKTALLCVVLGGACLALVWMVRRGPTTGLIAVWAAGVVLMLLVGVFLFAPDLAFKAVGKDATLTGRTQIWTAALHQWQAHRWLGFGYSVLWLHPGHWYPAAKIYQEAKFQAAHAHNGWIEVALGVGLVGVGLFAVWFLQVWGRALIRLFTGGGAYLVLPFLAMFTLRSATEVSILDYGDILWVILCAFAVKMGLDHARFGTNPG